MSRILTEARELGELNWSWIVDETRAAERVNSWSEPEAFAKDVVAGYRKDYWDQQPYRVEVWSEKGTVRGTLTPVLNKYGVPFRAMHGYSSATIAHDIAVEAHQDRRPLIPIYVGDYDCSGLHMSEVDLPARLERYGAPMRLARVALRESDCTDDLPWFPAETKKKDPRYKWFVAEYGDRCWELDALDPRILRDRVEAAILSVLDMDAWERCKVVERAEQQSLESIMSAFRGLPENTSAD